MSTVQVQLELPEQVARRLDPSGSGVAQRVLEVVLVQLFQKGAISSGQAAKLLGLSKDDFRRLLREHGVPYFNLTPEELGAELEASHLAEIQR